MARIMFLKHWRIPELSQSYEERVTFSETEKRELCCWFGLYLYSSILLNVEPIFRAGNYLLTTWFKNTIENIWKYYAFNLKHLRVVNSGQMACLLIATSERLTTCVFSLDLNTVHKLLYLDEPWYERCSKFPGTTTYKFNNEGGNGYLPSCPRRESICDVPPRFWAALVRFFKRTCLQCSISAAWMFFSPSSMDISNQREHIQWQSIPYGSHWWKWCMHEWLGRVGEETANGSNAWKLIQVQDWLPTQIYCIPWNGISTET